MPNSPVSGLTFHRVLELIADPKVGGKCWVENLTKQPISPGLGMAKINPGERLYLGTYQRLRAATSLSRSAETSAAADWSDIKASTFARISALLQILLRNGCPLVDPVTGQPIVFWDDDEMAAWEKLAHLHNQKFLPYNDLPEILAAYYRPGRLVISTGTVGADRQSAATTIDSAPLLSKYAYQSSVVVSEHGMDLLKALILADMERKGAGEDIQAYAATLLSQESGQPEEQVKEAVVYGLLLSGLRSILERSEMPADFDSTFSYLAGSLRTIDGLAFGGNAIELLRHCGLYNANGSDQRR